ncbi:polyphosphate kinase 2, PA0141 family [Monaibacterium marinum]|uniref:ADP/GDP-polyphosphate phosphotransferase n=1 Tax=Pontivivens marinum TaxID=1690039 RepID=A0A2C9CTM1_9RHOB|nr:polyphosphate kinase 2 [Monaibacterium marinum]SOH94550.1 polyphosphate kinase 2, PA0141 family [Monaibacterium marinum]
MSENELVGQITDYFENDAPKSLRKLIEDGGKKEMLDPTYPYSDRMVRDEYEDTLDALQIELVKMQDWVLRTGARVVVIFEGRDAAGKGGTISRVRQNLNPRVVRTVALAKPTPKEAGEWYFQRYIKHLPSAGNITLFDRSWYNRGVVEHVFGFCTPEQREHWFMQAPELERMLVNDGVHVIKIWLNVGRAEQLRRFLAREADPLKHWKLSSIDVKGLSKWDAYTDAISETLTRTHTDVAPWTVIRSEDKRRARIGAIRHILSRLPCDLADPAVIGEQDDSIVGGPELILRDA